MSGKKIPDAAVAGVAEVLTWMPLKELEFKDKESGIALCVWLLDNASEHLDRWQVFQIERYLERNK